MLAKSPKETFYTGGLSGFIASTASPIATGRSDPVPGWDLHPLLTSTFTAHTSSKYIGMRPDHFRESFFTP